MCADARTSPGAPDGSPAAQVRRIAAAARERAFDDVETARRALVARADCTGRVIDAFFHEHLASPRPPRRGGRNQLEV